MSQMSLHFISVSKGNQKMRIKNSAHNKRTEPHCSFAGKSFTVDQLIVPKRLPKSDLSAFRPSPLKPQRKTTLKKEETASPELQALPVQSMKLSPVSELKKISSPPPPIFFKRSSSALPKSFKFSFHTKSYLRFNTRSRDRSDEMREKTKIRRQYSLEVKQDAIDMRYFGQQNIKKDGVMADKKERRRHPLNFKQDTVWTANKIGVWNVPHTLAIAEVASKLDMPLNMLKKFQDIPRLQMEIKRFKKEFGGGKSCCGVFVTPNAPTHLGAVKERVFVTPNAPTHLGAVKERVCPFLQISRESAGQEL